MSPEFPEFPNIRYRAQPLIDVIGDRFQELVMVIDEAVNCRNHYVHGTAPPRLDYNNNFDGVIFFTDTLEFVFATSELIEAGWDIKTWIDAPHVMSHPFSSYCKNYAENLLRLKSLLEKSTAKS